VAKYKLTRPAEADLEDILAYTLRTWGGKQAERYLNDLQACFEELADQARLGRSCDSIRPGLRRMEHGRHVVFYRQRDYGIRIIRVLHQSSLPDQHLLDEKE
jgi:toxin ParE1/3/4